MAHVDNYWLVYLADCYRGDTLPRRPGVAGRTTCAMSSMHPLQPSNQALGANCGILSGVLLVAGMQCCAENAAALLVVTYTSCDIL